jgi:alanyl-tRNA synthetase
MTERLYYHDSFLYEFDAQVVDAQMLNGRPFVVLDQTAFYPTSGGQVFDTGFITLASDPQNKVAVEEVVESENGRILHYLNGATSLNQGERVRGSIDVDRRRDHMQQHSGQHVLSAAFIELFNYPTVSFHMGVDYCSIDLDAKQITAAQMEETENLANTIVTTDRKVTIRFVSREEAETLGLRKLPPAGREKLRLIEIDNFDLSACGGTHVASTGQIGPILLRKLEKVRQGWRVEFVCGKRAVSTARRDYLTLNESAALFSSQMEEVPAQIRKLQEESRAARKVREGLLEEIADLHAAELLATTPLTNSRKIIVQVFPDRDLTFIKLLAQRLTRLEPTTVALIASLQEPAALVFAQSAGQPFDMGAMMKEALAQLGGRGGGSKDMAQGGPQNIEQIESTLNHLASRLSSHNA